MTTEAHAHAATRTTASTEVDPREAQAMLAAGDCVLVDVREPDEHARERIAGARLIPLGRVTPGAISALGARRVLIHCKSGRRGGDAAARCAELCASGLEIANVHGGIEAWRAAGLPTIVDAARPKLGVMQQTQLVIGIGVVAGTALGAFVHPGFLAIPAFMGCGLMVAGATGFCGLATVLAKMPWNRTSGATGASCAR